MMRMRPIVLALALLAVMTAGCDTCGLIDQQIIVAADDPELGSLIADCQKGVAPPTDPTCRPPPPEPSSSPTIDCACLPLCSRVYEIVDPDPQRNPLVGCGLSIDSMGPANITIEYRSRCE
jgi:hypothetical protein